MREPAVERILGAARSQFGKLPLEALDLRPNLGQRRLTIANLVPSRLLNRILYIKSSKTCGDRVSFFEAAPIRRFDLSERVSPPFVCQRRRAFFGVDVGP